MTDRRAAAALFVLSFVGYAWFFQGGGFNQNVNLDLARAIAERGTLSIDAYHENTGDIAIVGGHVYSNKAPGLSVLAALAWFPVRTGFGAAGIELDEPLSRTIAAWLTTILVCGLLGALIPPLIFLHLRAGGTTPKPALGAALIAAFGTPLFAYSTMLFAHVPSAALTLAAYHLLFRRSGVTRPLTAGALLGAATTINYLCGPLLAIFAIGSLLRSRAEPDEQRPRLSWREPLLFALGSIPPLILLGAYHHVIFGSPFTTPMDSMNPAFVTEGAWLGIVQGPRIEALWGITFSPYRGLFFLSPVLLLAVFGALEMARRRRRVELGVIVASLAYFVLFNASFNGWHGGYTVGPRYLLPVVPFLAMMTAPALTRARASVAALGLVSFLFNFAVTAVDPQPPETLRNPVFQYAIPSLLVGRAAPTSQAPWLADWFTGHTAVNRQTVDEILPFRRYPPGSPPTEWASFNVGELLFPVGSLLSLLPIVVWIAGGSWLLLRRMGGDPADAR
ncbi:MAG TPA: hypothetical protein VMS56_06160 [Thermoanaerobaculia bacterium]|nr:hypothetical protein [Thermoanaerobaculia bacterium]